MVDKAEIICVDGEWYWLPTDDSMAHGPFLSQGDAVADRDAAAQVQALNHA